MIAWRASDGAQLALHRRGQGAPVQFQHGLGGDHLQTFDSFPDLPGWALSTLECRGHGASDRTGAYSIARFADDVADAMATDQGPGAEPAAGTVLGGISMGAAISARIAALRPAGLRALILVRPAWLDRPAPENLASIAEVAAMIARGQSAADFARTETHARLAREAPDNLAALVGFFARPHLGDVARLLAAIAADGPGISQDQIAAIRLPTLVCCCAEDAIHPMDLALAHARLIPGARLVELPPKGRDLAVHRAALHKAIATFLQEIRDV